MDKIYPVMRRHKMLIFIPSLAMVLALGLDFFNPLLTRAIVDRVIIGGERELMVPIIGALLAVTLVRAVLGYTKEYLFDYFSTKVIAQLKDDTFSHILSQNFKYFDTMNTGELMSRMSEDVENVWNAVGYGIRLIIENILYFLLAFFVLMYFHWQLTLICLVIMLPVGYIAVQLEKKSTRNFEEISDHIAQLNTTAQENIAGVRLVKAFSRERHEISKFFGMNQRNYELNNEQAEITAKYFPPIEFLTNLSVVAMIGFGGYFVITDSMTVGTLVAFSTYIWNLIWPLRELGWLINLASQNKSSLGKLRKIYEVHPEITDKEDAVDLEVDGNIEFRNVTFSYGEQTILEDVSFSAKAGDTVAIMGTTGSGKSSLTGLIGRYYDFQDGDILVDGVSIRDISLDSLRKNMAIVPQDTFLFSESIENNVKFGKKDATKEEVENALSLACADFVMDFEEGLDTVIGERGVGLSGGQKQRIAIARAIIRKSPIMVLDDATSALDMDTEYNLLRNLRNLPERKTLFIIAHRISAVKNADLILFMEDGRVAERGTHEELIARGGRYYDVYREQFKDFDSLMEVNA